MSSGSKKCPKCGIVNFATEEACKRCATALKDAFLKEYKVLTQRDDLLLGGKFDPATLEQRLNAYAAQRWRVISIAIGEYQGGFGKRDEIVVVLERDSIP